MGEAVTRHGCVAAGSPLVRGAVVGLQGACCQSRGKNMSIQQAGVTVTDEQLSSAHRQGAMVPAPRRNCRRAETLAGLMVAVEVRRPGRMNVC